jgi:uncharacterized protein with HEPN domain
MISIEDKQHLMNIADAIDEIEAYVQGENYEAFALDDMSKEAVTRLMQDIGGATKLLSDDFKASYGDVDWNAFIGLENAMYDQAYEVENEAIWSIIKNDIPILRQQVTDLAANLREEDDIHGYDLTPDDPMTH